MKRRNFIKYTTAATGLASYLKLGQIPVYATSKNELADFTESEDKILIIIQLFGGNDGLNTIVPADDDKYYNKYRTTLNIPKNKLTRLSNSNSYLNNALKEGQNEGLLGLYKNGQLGIIQGVGYPKPNLSHFRSTDIWLSGITPATDSERLETGWLGRYFEKTQTQEPDYPTSVDIGTSSSLLFQSTKQNMAISLEDPNNFYESGKDILTGDTKLNESSVYASERNFLLDLSIQSNKYSAVVKKAFDGGKNVASYESEKLSDELKLVARLISGGLKTKVYKVSIDGFDTHANQGSDSGKHASLLSSISKAVGAFMTDMKSQKLSEKIIGMTVSEFGRRPEQNASNGTDHGAASVMFMFGDAINGKIFGKNLGFDTLDTNKDFVFQYDYRQVYDEIMTKWFLSNTTTTNEILKGRYKQIEDGLILVKGSALSVEPVLQKQTKIYPNPTTDGFVMLNMVLEQPSFVSIQLSDSKGVQRQIMPKIMLPEGSQQIPLTLEMNSGLYFIQVQINEHLEVHKVMKI